MLAFIFSSAKACDYLGESTSFSEEKEAKRLLLAWAIGV
jgi:hypothetical protein